MEGTVALPNFLLLSAFFIALAGCMEGPIPFDDRCDHDGQGFDETCPECHAFMDTDPHLESCPYAALMREIEARARRPIEEITAGKLLLEAGRPVLLIHARDDEAVAFSEAEAIVATTNGLATLEPTTGLGHRRIVVMPHVVRRAVRFLSE